MTNSKSIIDESGVASSSNGIDWTRGHGGIEGARGAAKEGDVGRVLAPNEEDWWWLDTRHMTVSDVQVKHKHCFCCCFTPPPPSCFPTPSS
jgi:hypothetical protein